MLVLWLGSWGASKELGGDRPVFRLRLPGVGVWVCARAVASEV